MAIADLPALAALRTRMQWHQQRQRVLAENIANSDTPNFKPRDLVEPKFTPSGATTEATGALALARTDPGHMTLPEATTHSGITRPSTRHGRPAIRSAWKTR